jgi:hypothetical protein
VTATIAGVAAAVRAASLPPADKVSPGILGFAVVFVLALATWLLLHSMIGHLRKVRYSADPAAPTTAADPDGASGSPRATSGGTRADGTATPGDGSAVGA